MVFRKAKVADRKAFITMPSTPPIEISYLPLDIDEDDKTKGVYIPDPADDIAEALCKAYKKTVTITITETLVLEPEPEKEEEETE